MILPGPAQNKNKSVFFHRYQIQQSCCICKAVAGK